MPSSASSEIFSAYFGGFIMKPPTGLGARGRRMWRQSVETWQLTPAHLVLLEEACRIADRLDLLDGLICGGSADDEDDGPISGGLAGLLAESRQQSVALKGILAELRQGQKATGAPERAGAEGKGVSDLSARIAARRKQASG